MFYEAVLVKHLTMGHDFKCVPGQVLFKMVLDACHAGIERDFERARKALEAMTLDDFPGHGKRLFGTRSQTACE
jgi:hypothetical protein